MPIRDTRLMARAILQRWPVKQEYRQAIINRLAHIAIDPASSPREATSAAKAIMSAEKQNQDDEHKVIDVQISKRHAELSGLALDLGIEIDALENVGGQSEGGDHPTQRLGSEPNG